MHSTPFRRVAAFVCALGTFVPEICVLGGGILGTGPPVYAFSCTAGEVTIGQGVDEVITNCGTPVQRSEWLRQSWHPAAPAVTRGETVEEWVYDLGSNLPVGLVRFTNQVVEWQGEGAPTPAACDPEIFQPGQTLVTVAAACGLPQRTSEQVQRRTVVAGDGSVVRATVHTIEWFYDGPAVGGQRLHLRFENGRSKAQGTLR
ncbi:MAG: DUF2845 domain-containing protein [Nitrospirota bacterium]|nr:DUF2845 domain-containing protein [Nitrospirota bacterium]